MKGFILGMFVMCGLLLLAGVASASFVNNGDGTITFGYTLSTAQAAELRDALCHNYDYQTEIMDINGNYIPNPESCQDFAWRQGKKFFVDNIKSYRKYQEEQNINLGSDPAVS